MIHAVILFSLLLLTWVILSGFFSGFFIALGSISCGLAVYVSFRICQQQGVNSNLVRLLFKLPGYMAWLEWEIIKSSIDVAVKMWQIDPEIEPALNWVKTSQKEEVGSAIYANSITLTPGTVSVMVENGRIQVHALHKSGIKDLKKGEMDKRVSSVVGTNVKGKAA